MPDQADELRRFVADLLDVGRGEALAGALMRGQPSMTDALQTYVDAARRGDALNITLTRDAEGRVIKDGTPAGRESFEDYQHKMAFARVREDLRGRHD